ncbi:DUF5809 family protein [Haloarchaeobius sp. TZWWS8]|uniref:DUF5809 family protein n=1 Tax=Haloarchaeobius sp. TZWWS8 TaxID=3446121 RepID=UPI003EBAD872
MHTVGTLTPETEAEARDAYESVGPTAQLVVKEVAKAMQFDREEYRDRVDTDVVATARDVLFAAELAVHVGSRAEYDEWRDGFDGEVLEMGNENVDNVVWHVAPFANEAVAATFQQEEDAAVGTLRRQALGKLYRDRL